MARRAKKGEAAFIGQCEALADRWGAIDPATIGMTPQTVGAFGEKQAEAKATAEAVVRARAQLDAALHRKRAAVDALRASFGAATGTIDAYAKTTGDRGVYATALIAPPEKPGTRPTPPTPQLERVRTLAYGPIELRFTPCGERVFYDIQRSVVPLGGPRTPWEHVTSTGYQRVRDRRVPRGVAAVLYRVRAHRTSGRASGWSNPVTVEFGCRASKEVGAAPMASASSGRGAA